MPGRADTQVHGARYVTPPFITNTGCCTAWMSTDGSPRTGRGWVAAAWLAVSMLAGAALANRLGQDASGDQLQ